MPLSDYTELKETTVEDANALIADGWHLLSIAQCAKPRVHADSKNVYVSKYLRYVVGKYDPLTTVPSPEEQRLLDLIPAQ